MRRFLHLVERLLLPTMAIVSLIVSLGGAFNLFHLIPAGQISTISFVLTSIMLGALVFIQRKCNAMEDTIEQLLSKEAYTQLKESIRHINPDLRKVVGDDYFFGLFQVLETAIHASEVEVKDTNSFRLNLKRMLRAYPGATFLSTNSLATSYLWNERDIIDTLKHFIDEGGNIKQIFFVRSPEEAVSRELQTTLAVLRETGITLCVVNSACIPANQEEYFIVESRKRIGWNIPVDDRGHIGLSVITAEAGMTANYFMLFKTLWENAE